MYQFLGLDDIEAMLWREGVKAKSVDRILAAVERYGNQVRPAVTAVREPGRKCRQDDCAQRVLDGQWCSPRCFRIQYRKDHPEWEPAPTRAFRDNPLNAPGFV